MTHGGAWGWILTHKLTAAKDKEAILLVASDCERFAGYNQDFLPFVENGIFNRVIKINGNVGELLDSESEIINAINDDYDKLFEKEQINLFEIENFYSSADSYHTFGLYLTQKGIPYFYFEIGLNHCKNAYNRYYPNGPTFKALQAKNGAYGALHPLVNPILYPQSDNVYPDDKHVEYFNPLDAMNEITDEQWLAVRRATSFEAHTYNVTKSFTLMVCCSRHYIYDAIKKSTNVKNYFNDSSSKGYALFYQLLLDLLTKPDSQIVMKWHPTREITDYRVNFPSVISVSRYLDMQFFSRLCKQDSVHFNQTINMSMTAGRKQDNDLSANVLNLNNEFAIQSHLLLRFDVICEMILKLKPTAKKIVICEKRKSSSTDSVILFIEYLTHQSVSWVSYKKLDDTVDVVIFTDLLTSYGDGVFNKLNQTKSDTLYFFPNEDGVSQDRMNNIDFHKYGLMFTLEKALADQRSLINTRNEYITVLTNSDELRSELYSFSYENKLRYTATKISLKRRYNEVGVCVSAEDTNNMYIHGDYNARFEGGLSPLLLTYYILNLINKKVILWSNEVTVSKAAAKFGDDLDSIKLNHREKINLHKLFSLLVLTNAPDVCVAFANYLTKITGKSTLKELAMIAEINDIDKQSILNITGLSTDSNPQYFCMDSLIKISRLLLSYDQYLYTKVRSTVHNDITYENKSILAKTYGIVNYIRYKIGNIISCIAYADYGDCSFYAAAAGMTSQFCCDARILHDLMRIRHGSVTTDGTFLTTDKSRITIAGDTYCGEKYTQYRIKHNIEDPLQRFGNEGYIYSFEKVSPFLSTKSYNIINSECVLTDNYSNVQQSGKYINFVLGANPEQTANTYNFLRINAVMTANNHMKDYWSAGIRDTIRHLSVNDISCIGIGNNIDEAEKPLCLDMQGRKVIIFNAYGFFSTQRYEVFSHYSLGENTGTAFLGLNERNSLLSRIRLYRHTYPDAFIVLSPHWSNDFNNNFKSLRELAFLAVDAGVDLIIGHGPHIPIGAEHCNGKLVVYSLGDFVFNTTGIDRANGGYSMFNMVVRLNFMTNATWLRLYPIYGNNRETFFQPYPVTETQMIEFTSDFLGISKFKQEKDNLGYYLKIKL
jgi:poly-gamma-glutamate capsule biosynthesis protein CapA/YwtB (metallophosphatase superfamily)